MYLFIITHQRSNIIACDCTQFKVSVILVNYTLLGVTTYAKQKHTVISLSAILYNKKCKKEIEIFHRLSHHKTQTGY
jgi:hypothetical protein